MSFASRLEGLDTDALPPVHPFLTLPSCPGDADDPAVCAWCGGRESTHAQKCGVVEYRAAAAWARENIPHVARSVEWDDAYIAAADARARERARASYAAWLVYHAEYVAGRAA